MSAPTVYEKEMLGELVAAAKAAISRSRYVFGVTNIASVIVVAAEYNVTFPWIRNAISRAANCTSWDVMERLLWNDLSTVSVPLIGIKLSIFDLSFVASIGMCILTLWFFYSVRRENHVIRRICSEALRAADCNDFHKAAYLYHGVAHQMVFTDAIKDRPRFGAQWISRVLLYAPCIALLSILVCDAKSLIDEAKLLQVTNGCAAAIANAIKGFSPGHSLLHWLSSSERIEVLFRSSFCVVALAFCATQCLDSQRLEADSGRKLFEVRERVES